MLAKVQNCSIASRVVTLSLVLEERRRVEIGCMKKAP